MVQLASFCNSPRCLSLNLLIPGNDRFRTKQVLSLLKGVDQKKLIALRQSGALEDVMTNQVQGEKKLAKVVQECVYPLLPRDVRDMYDAACHDSYAGYPDWTSAKWTEVLESVDPFPEAKPSLDAYPHNPLVNGRARIAPSEALRRFKLPANANQAVVDTEFKFFQDKQIKPLLRLAMHGLEHATADGREGFRSNGGHGQAS